MITEHPEKVLFGQLKQNNQQLGLQSQQINDLTTLKWDRVVYPGQPYPGSQACRIF